MMHGNPAAAHLNRGSAGVGHWLNDMRAVSGTPQPRPCWAGPQESGLRFQSVTPTLPGPQGSSLRFQSVSPTSHDDSKEDNSVTSPISHGRDLSRSEFLSTEDLRVELQRFAKHTLSRHLDEHAVRIRKEIVEDVRRFFPTSLVSDDYGHDSQPVFNYKAEDMKRPVGQQLPGDSRSTSPLQQADELTKSQENRHQWAKRHRRNAIISAEVSKLKEMDEVSLLSDPCEPAKGQTNTDGFVEEHTRTTCRFGKLCESNDSLDQLEAGVTQKPSLRGKAQAIVRSTFFENSVTVIIIGNVLYIALVTNHMAVNELSVLPQLCQVFEMIFLTLFLAEIAFRLFALPTISFVQRGDRRKLTIEYWNIFDSIVVGTQLVEMLCDWMNVDSNMFGQITVLRLLRLIRIIRVARVVKVFRVVRHLRMIVFSTFRSLGLFLWSVIALLMVTFMWGVYFTEVTLSHKIAHGQNGIGNEALDTFFGSLPLAMLSLLQGVTGGIDWNDVCTSLQELDTIFGLIPFLAYVFFTSIALMNVITGVFLETAMERAREEKEIYLVRNARVVFAAADKDRSGRITWPDFKKALQNSDLYDFFEAIDIDITEAENLFDLLDISGDGKISAEEFLSGCLRVRGPAKSLDLLVLSREVAQLFERHAATAAKLDWGPQAVGGRLPSNASPHLLDNHQRAGIETTHTAPSVPWLSSSCPNLPSCQPPGSRPSPRLMSLTDKLKVSVSSQRKTAQEDRSSLTVKPAMSDSDSSD
eukprot:TRINITY_DN11513_c0_g5_i1.p1 TRINITY_DN11513_c0_g5~~TRINITY_DN11513_c0_g5_i1.p1  ORF type:complete len:772 (+),score=117.17 TRINITY_DN11513_c0_g5_i1:62-2317(+)